jgi:hypothetical protein
MSATIALVGDIVAAAFSLGMDLLYKLGQVDEATIANAKQLCISRIENYSSSEAAQNAREWEIAQGLEP